MNTHAHEFAAIWSHFGPYGPQDVHYHACFTISCTHIIIAPGRSCDGDRLTHNRTTLRKALAGYTPIVDGAA